MPFTGNFLYTQLSIDALTAGRLFDGLAVGTFTDMHGRPVEIKLSELPVYLANTLAAIAATKAESGEVVGLPIDARDHENGDGSGWIVGAELEGNRIRLLPKWTELGVDLVKKGIRRFFSATVDLGNRVILGGTLTNWPATRSPQGHILLRPIELAQAPGVYALAEASPEDSLNDQLADVSDAWRAQYEPPEPLPYCYIVEVFTDRIIVSMDGDLYAVAYSRGADDAITFAPRDEWKAVKPTYVDAAMRTAVQQMRRIARYLGLDVSDLAAGKKEGLPARCYLSLSDPNDPSTWALPICEMVDGKATVTAKKLGNAAAALSAAGFQGNQYKPKGDETIDALKSKLKAQYKKLGVADSDLPDSLTMGEDDMSIKLSEMTPEDRAEIVKQAAALVAVGQGQGATGAAAAQSSLPAGAQTAAAAAVSPVDLSQLLGVQALTEDGKKKLADLMQQQAAHVQEQAALAFQAQMATIQRDAALTDLSMRLTGGTPDAPRGYRGATADELKKHLATLPPVEAKWFTEFLTVNAKDGLLEFTELGHGRKLVGGHNLPAEIAAELDKGSIKVADLGSPVLGLGDLSQYDLSKWQAK